MLTQWEQRLVTDSYLRINALFSVTVAATGAWLVSLTIGKKVQLVCQCHSHFTDLLMSLSIGPSGTILQSHRGWNELCEFFTSGHIGWRFSLVTLVGGRAWDGQSDSKWSSTKTQLWCCINILANLNHKVWIGARLSRFSLSEQQGPGWKFTGSDNIGDWHVKSQCCDPSNSLPRLIYSWAALRGWQTNVKSTVTHFTITNEFCRPAKNTSNMISITC